GDVRFGCCREPVDALNVTRLSALMAGIPETVTAATVNRVCISGMEAVISGMAMIQAGMVDIVLAGGMEHMSGIPYSVPGARWGCRFQDQVLVDDIVHALHAGSHLLPGLEQGPIKEGPVVDLFRGKPYIMGITAELIAQKHNMSRREIDEVALRSHNNAERATKEGDFFAEIIPIEFPGKKGKPPVIFQADEHFRPGLTMEELAKLPAAFIPKTGKVTAGNSSGVNDGASAMLIMSAEKAKELGKKPLARIKAVGRGGCHPSVMGLSPVPAVNDLMAKSGLKIRDFELVEVNEAFAAQYLGVERELGLNRDVTNVNGSGCGLGHPVGSTGCRIIVTLLHAMQKRGKTLGMATLCGGGGVSLATVIEMI
ncbi:MAG: thiolase family protein, partial [Syntrophales bacterium]|nr:thiolase family protein [Syntrophales bacterium]